MNGKSPFASRTLWLNLLVTLLALIELQWGLLDGLLPVPFYKAVAFGLPIVNMLLRFITRQPLVLGKGSTPEASP